MNNPAAMAIAEITKPGLSVAQRTAAIMANGYDYRNQAWVVDGKYVACAHPEWMKCNCFGTVHAGEALKANADLA